jgi:chromosomal replication initiation ATPase DnaA
MIDLNGMKPTPAQQLLASVADHGKVPVTRGQQVLASFTRAERLLAAVTAHYQVPVSELRSPWGKRELSRVRHIAMYLIQRETTLSLRQIAQLFNCPGISTVFFGLEHITEELSHDAELRKTLEQLAKDAGATGGTQGDRAPLIPPTHAQQLLASVADHFKVSVKALQSSSRKRSLVRKRQIAMYLIRRETRLSLPQIGIMFGHRHHTTVLHGLRRIENDLSREEKLRMTLERLARAAAG